MLQDLIWQLLGVDMADGRLITSRLDVRPKIEVIEALVPRRIKDEQAAKGGGIMDILDLVQSRQADRNFIVHGSWGTLMPRMVPLAMSLREQSETPSQVIAETFPEGRMREIINDLDAAILRAAKIMNALFPSPDRPESPIPGGKETRCPCCSGTPSRESEPMRAAAPGDRRRLSPGCSICSVTSTTSWPGRRPAPSAAAAGWRPARC